jgi:homoserine kinase
MPASAELVAALRAQGAAAVVSGAGPAVLVFSASRSDAAAVEQNVTQLTRRRGEGLGSWQVLTPDVDTDGALDISTALP